MGTKQHSNYESLITFTRASAGHALRPVSYGTELVTNTTPNFDLSPSVGSFDTGVDAVAGKIYMIDVSATVTVSSVSLRINNSTSNWSEVVNLTIADGDRRIALQALTSGDIQINRNDASATANIATLSIKEVLFDQSDGTLTLFEHPDNIPRVEWDSAGNRLGLLVEESRTNLTTISEPTLSDLSNSGNVSDGDFGNSLGLSNGIAFGDNSVTRFAYRSATVSSGQDYVVSVFVKMDDGSAPNVGNGTTSGDFGLVIGSSLVTSASNISVTAMSDNVYRVSGTRTASSTDSQHGVIKYTGQSAKGFTITGFQIEQASFGSSYIKTTGSSATRSADVASIPVADFGYNQSEGSVVVEFQVDRDVDVGGTGIFMLTESQGSTAEVTRLYLRSIATLGYTNRTNGANDVDMTISGGAVNPNELTKVGVAYKENDFAAVRGGGTMTTDQTGSPATHKYLELRNAEYLNGHIKSIKYYPRRLSNAQLQALTSQEEIS